MSRQNRIWIALIFAVLAIAGVVLMTSWSRISGTSIVLATGFWIDDHGRTTYFVADYAGYKISLPGGFDRMLLTKVVWRDASPEAADVTIHSVQAAALVRQWQDSGVTRIPTVPLPTSRGQEIRNRIIALFGWLGALLLVLGCVTGSCYNVNRLRLRAPHECLRCGYDLSGLRTGVCPECGASMDPNR